MDQILFAGAVLLSLAFLAIIFGDRLSLFGLADGRWLSAPADLAAWFWDMVCEAADRLWCFVFDHFWWVTAAASGGIGILLIATMLVTGLTEKAEADRHSIAALMRAGSVLDHTPVVDAEGILQISGEVADLQNDLLLYQTPTFDNRWPVPRSIRRVITDFNDRQPVPEATDVPPLESLSPDYFREPTYSRGRLTLSMEPFVERHGRRVRSRDVEDLIRNSLFSLRRDDWNAVSLAGMRERSRPFGGATALAEDPQFAVDDQQARVRVIPGDLIMASDILVEKSAPQDASNGEFEIQIRVRNRSRQRVDGLIVRELVPQSWRVTDMQPRGTYRNSVVTWLLNNMQPLEEQLLTLSVSAEETGRFQSYTEVSATAAVSAAAQISSRRPAQPVRPLPPVRRLPDVRLRLLEEPLPSVTDRNVDVLFQISNIGDAPATGVTLRVTLPRDLDHHVLARDAIQRNVDSRIAELSVGERRQVRLTVMPRTAGTHSAIAELRLQDDQLDVQRFEIVARAAATPGGDDPDFRNERSTPPRSFDERSTPTRSFDERSTPSRAPFP